LKNLQKHVATPRKAYLEEGFFFFDKDSDSDEGSEYEKKDIDEEELAK